MTGIYEKAPVSITDFPVEGGVFRLRDGWRFHEGDIPFPPVSGHHASYNNAKTGKASGAAAPFYDDAHWRSVCVPHDWAIAQPVDPAANLSQGFRRGGVGWYRGYFRLPAMWQDRDIELAFGGAATHATVWVNGALLYRSFSGAIPFRMDIGPFARFGDSVNVVAVRVDANEREGWYYEGAGIYRDVTVHVRPALHIATDGVLVRPVRQDGDTWQVQIEAEVRNRSGADRSGRLRVALVDESGTTLAGDEQPVAVPGDGHATLRCDFTIRSPQRWAPEHPVRYPVRCELVGADGLADRCTVFTGFRTVAFDPAEGFRLNGKPYKIQGVCCHQDHAGVGVAVPVSLLEYRLRRLKEMGANAYRCAHHPPHTDLLDCCDRLGLLVLDEVRAFSCAEAPLRELAAIVRRDRNHPAVFMWCLGNEEPLQSTRTGVEIARRMRACIRALDPTRPVTAAMNGGLFAERHLGEVLDVVGINYQPERYDDYHQAHPDRCLISTEDGGGVMSRGETRTDLGRGWVAAYDDEVVAWGSSYARSWVDIASRPFMAGGFHWTGIDYHGEGMPCGWPSASSFFGMLDLCGHPKTAYYIKKTHWRSTERTLFIFPHWNWPDAVGQPIRVVVITNAAHVTLAVNGRELETRAVKPDHWPEWLVPYEPGCLEARAVWADGEAQTQRIETTGRAQRIVLTPDRDVLLGDGDDCVPVRVAVVDDDGREVPTAAQTIRFRVEGPAVVAGTGNGDPNDHDPETEPVRRLYHGLAQVLVRHDGHGGAQSITPSVRLYAESDGLETGVAEWTVRPVVPGCPVWPTAEPALCLTAWQLSPRHDARPDPTARINADDMNTWEAFSTDSSVALAAGDWALLHTVVTVPDTVVRRGGHLVFPTLGLVKECWRNGARCDWTPVDDGQRQQLAIPPGEAAQSLVLVLHATRPAPLRLPFAPTLTPRPSEEMNQENKS